MSYNSNLNASVSDIDGLIDDTKASFEGKLRNTTYSQGKQSEMQIDENERLNSNYLLAPQSNAPDKRGRKNTVGVNYNIICDVDRLEKF
jgi:hypothetical protein